MSWEVITEEKWKRGFYGALQGLRPDKFDFVTGPGRSGAVASVYASHYLGVPFKPHKAGNYTKDKAVLLVDTVEYTGRTLRKAKGWYENRGLDVTVVYGVKECRGHYYKMWYESVLQIM